MQQDGRSVTADSMLGEVVEVGGVTASRSRKLRRENVRIQAIGRAESPTNASLQVAAELDHRGQGALLPLVRRAT